MAIFSAPPAVLLALFPLFCVFYSHRVFAQVLCWFLSDDDSPVRSKSSLDQLFTGGSIGGGACPAGSTHPRPGLGPGDPQPAGRREARGLVWWL